MDCARRRIRHKRHYGQRIDTTFTPPPIILARDQLNPYLQAARRKEVEQWQSGADHNVIANSLGKSIAHSSTARIPYSEFSLLTLIGTAFPQRNEVRTHLCLGSTEIAQWIVRAAAALSLECTYVLIHRYSCLLLRWPAEPIR